MHGLRKNLLLIKSKTPCYALQIVVQSNCGKWCGQIQNAFAQTLVESILWGPYLGRFSLSIWINISAINIIIIESTSLVFSMD